MTTTSGLQDHALHLEVFFPPAGATITAAPMDIGVDQPAFSNQWRQGVLRISWPALPSHVNASLNAVVTLVDSADYGATYQAGSTGIGAAFMLPLIQVSIPGVASTGAPPGYCDFPMPPGLRGPFGVQVTSPAGPADLTQALLSADWLVA